ncbi:uncharacterized protein [Dysidea avara]|uniref:uncharacterized protein n=1 Tax=Dysidea avara TaxID=196820 RepID=UPI003332AF77
MEEARENVQEEVRQDNPVSQDSSAEGHWVWVYTRYVGQRIYTAVESFAESLFWHLGITSPQYLHIIELYEDMKEEERLEREAEERALAEAGLETLDRLESQPDVNT